jgi:hypothetical protein
MFLFLLIVFRLRFLTAFSSCLPRFRSCHIMKPQILLKPKRDLPLSLLTDASIADGFSNAFVGGTIGVMSVMFLLEFQKIEDTTLEGCPYCLGKGEILCATCFGQGKATNGFTCGCCSGRGLVMCVNCKGDGRNMPLMLQSKAVRDPEYSPDGVSIDSP